MTSFFSIKRQAVKFLRSILALTAKEEEEEEEMKKRRQFFLVDRSSHQQL